MRAYITLFTYQAETKKGYPIKILIRDQNKTRSYHTKMFSTVQNWNSKKEEVKKSHLRHVLYNQELKILKATIATGILHAQKNNWNLDQLYNFIAGGNKALAVSFFQFANIRIGEETAKGKIGNAQAYKVDVDKLYKFCGQDFSFSQLNYNFLSQFKTYYLAHGNSPNTIHRNFRTYRAIFNEAIRREIISPNNYPFKSGLMPTPVKTAKKNVSRVQLYRLRDMPLNRAKAFARDLYMLMFYLAGMDYVDISQYQFKPQEKYITYQRHKLGGTGQNIKIKISPPARAILEKYNYRLNLNPVTIKPYSRYTTGRNRINKNLKAIAKELKFPIVPTTKTARHTFATLAKKKYINPEVLKDLMGHEGHEVSDIYKDRHPQKKLDKALYKILKIN